MGPVPSVKAWWSLARIEYLFIHVHMNCVCFLFKLMFVGHKLVSNNSLKGLNRFSAWKMSNCCQAMNCLQGVLGLHNNIFGNNFLFTLDLKSRLVTLESQMFNWRCVLLQFNKWWLIEVISFSEDYITNKFTYLYIATAHFYYNIQTLHVSRSAVS